jgi:amino acid adenylation domain-containing protein
MSVFKKPATQQCLHGLFEEQAERTPNARAIVAQDGEFTYAELDRRSNQLAHYLQSLGIGPEKRAGVALPRSAEMIVAALAILKAGGAYVPMDPAYPLQRFKYLAENSGVSVLLTHRAVPEGVNTQQIKIVPLESHWRKAAAMPEHAPRPLIEDANLAYIIYTSGSTGKPKGVMVSHENVVRSTEARRNYYAMTPERFLVLSSFSFDSSVASIFWTLATGGELWLPPEGTQQNIARIREFVRRGRITHLLALPSLYRPVLLHAGSDGIGSLRTVIVAGEACPAELLTEHFRHLPETLLFNEYGPTEASVWCTVHQATPVLQSRSVPIGKPISSAEVHVLNPLMEPVLPMAAGEIYIGGPQVARGYLDRPDITAERFVPNAFSKVPGARLYRTGDIGRHSADSNLEFLGRTDQQVKIRGYRIEPGEIEAALHEHPEIRETAVASKKDRLVAYVVAKPGQKIDAAGLRRFLRQHLPEYMTPATYITLDSLPVNANGKLDRQALPDPKPAESQNTYVAPRNAIEDRLAHIWAELLGIKQVGVHDNFFDLGGDSILGLQMVARTNQAGIRLNLTEIIERPTIAEIAASGHSRDDAAQPRTAVPQVPPLP